MSMKTYSGSCHCGAVRFQAELDFAEGTVKCNCTSCMKARSWLILTPASRFRLVEGETPRRNINGPRRDARSRPYNFTFVGNAGFVPRGAASLRRWAAPFMPSRFRCSMTLIPTISPLRRSAMSTVAMIASIGRRTTSASSKRGSNPAPNPSTIVDVVLGKSFAQARFLEGDHDLVHGGPGQHDQDQRPGFAEGERQSRR